jgi:hypothetical protein
MSIGIVRRVPGGPTPLLTQCSGLLEFGPVRGENPYTLSHATNMLRVRK